MTPHRGERALLRSRGRGSSWTDRDPRALQLWFPGFFLREVVALLLVTAGLTALALLVDAPLLAIADPASTPDPSKAPWYFVGLQELLHYYPPVVSGALVPAGAVVLLVLLPYLGRPERRVPLWTDDTRRGVRLIQITAGVAVGIALMVLPAAHLPWALLVPTLVVAAGMAAPAVLGTRSGVGRWLSATTLRGWLVSWGATTAVVLSIIGALFRGPGWSWTWPWLDGIF